MASNRPEAAAERPGGHGAYPHTPEAAQGRTAGSLEASRSGEGPLRDYGTVTVSKRYDHELGRYAVHIDQADPLALISPELLDQARNGEAAPFLTANGDVLTISDDYRQRFIYRVGRLVDESWCLAYEIEWPD